MQRRTLLKLLGSAAILGPALSSVSLADGQTYGGPYWIFVTAMGGWDPRFMFDPSLDTKQNRLYTEVGKIGNISYAPIPLNQEALGLGVETDFTPYMLDNEQFLTRFGKRLVVFNGVDTATNSHEVGQRAAVTGSNGEGHPAMGALVARSFGASQPVAFMSAGGYDFTANLVPLSRVTDPDALRGLAAPNQIDPKKADSESFHSPDTWSRIRNMQSERLASRLASEKLPHTRRKLESLAKARETDGALSVLKIPEKLVEIPSYQLDDLERFERNAQLAIGAFASGIAVSASLQLGGFDTHANHDRDQLRQIYKLWGGLAYILDQLDAFGLGQNTFVVVSSDFARGPRYNGENTNSGKDHWPVTSTLVLGPGIEGDRVIGGSTPDQLALKLDPSNLAAGSEGTKLTPTLIHRSLRAVAKLDPELDKRFPLPGESLPLLG